MDSTKLRVVLFLGSTREGRFGLRVAKFMKKHLESRKYVVDLFDPVELNFPMLEKPIHFYGEGEVVPQWLKNANSRIESADAFVIVSAEYNHGIPPALSNMMDHFPPSVFAGKPSAVVSYSLGMFGGVVAATHLRSFLSILGCINLPNVFSIPKVNTALDEEGHPLHDHMDSGAEKLLVQLNWITKALKNHRKTNGPMPIALY